MMHFPFLINNRKFLLKERRKGWYEKTYSYIANNQATKTSLQTNEAFLHLIWLKSQSLHCILELAHALQKKPMFGPLSYLMMWLFYVSLSLDK